jgi:hypothetical protein
MGTGALMKLLMHTEDGKGLWVKDSLTSDVYKLTGDASMFENNIVKNKVIAAGKIGMDEIMRPILEAQNRVPERFPKEGDVYKAIPKSLTPQEARAYGQYQTSPLFKVEKGELMRRKDAKDPKCTEYTKDWTILGTVWELKSSVAKYFLPKWMLPEVKVEVTKDSQSGCIAGDILNHEPAKNRQIDSPVKFNNFISKSTQKIDCLMNNDKKFVDIISNVTSSKSIFTGGIGF